ncbi:aminopeptidase N [uncultured Methylophaga sp.]|uniref:aminopeptidase N n=1 Tax=uncultured Methylophaga sp. TaxID=285271 RepID=UPI0030DDCBD1|tara:strand:- start:1130 stop:3781 length:2652 start_codon:yes stop_codon:yes gene_type:complete
MNAPASPKTIRLADYTVPSYLVDNVDLHFDLDASTTRVTSILNMRRNPKGPGEDCVLNGEHLELISIKLDGRTLTAAEIQRSNTQLVLPQLPEKFQLEIVTEIYPDQNTALEGLYHSGALVCTQCEAEGFRRITYYPDRPDVMAVFTVTITADKHKWPILLSNGNLQEQGELEDGRHWVRWHDPHPKPCYLFALVAGDLYMQQDSFTTLSGRDVTLQIYVDKENHDKCDHALLSLKQSMRWDEETYGREYDLDVFMIVAVNDFNMGAMENKGLNIFNAACVLASPKTATDNDFYTIQSIVGHEYFHNWSGNRVTCRDWFQLSLKEGFTVMRDQSFSADLNSAAVQRIDDVDQLRSLQFAEDAGPMAHPVRPDSYIEISNFYTVTIYEKGAEVVRMIKTLAGEEGFRKGTDLYFDRHDGQAVTTDDFVKAIEDANRIDLTQFKRWYTQAGTPVIKATHQYDATKKILTLTLQQYCPATPGQTEKQPFLIPVAMGLLDAAGNSLPLQLIDEAQPYDHDTRVLELSEAEQTFRFIGVEQKPVVSLLRGFSAPVKLLIERDNEELAFLMANEKDSFNRWDAGQSLFIQVMLSLINDYQQGKPLQLPEILSKQCAAVLEDKTADPALVARMLTLPSENYLAAQMKVADVDAIHHVRKFVKDTLAMQLKAQFNALYQQHNLPNVPYQFNSEHMGRRSLKNVCLGYLMATGDPMQTQRCLKQMKQADNMTDTLSGLRLMVDQPGTEREHALRAFYEQWQHDRQVVDKWLTVQALSSLPDTLIRIKGLMKHPAFSIKNPNNVRALIGQFCRNNPALFHAKDGSGYRFLAEQILLLDKINPQVASRQLGAFNSWRRYDAKRQEMMRDALQNIAQQQDLSSDVYEIVNKYLAD